MRTDGNTVLITGGATGVGFALAKKFSELGNTVIICGRRDEKLKEAQKKVPALHTRKCDISREEERKALYDWISKDFGGLNVLINNAGIQRQVDFRKGMEDLIKNEDEIAINLASQIYLAARFIPLLLKNKDSAIVNISSGLGLVPMAMFPVYSATKAAIHSFSMSLRHQLKDTGISVFEVVPPVVHDTLLKGKELERSERSISSSELAEVVLKGMEEGRFEIGAGPANGWLNASKSDLDQAFMNMNK